MKTGITFKFNHFSILHFAEFFMQREFPDLYASGKMEVRDLKDTLGIAGQLKPDVLLAIPHGAELSIVADFDESQLAQLIDSVREANIEITYKAGLSDAHNTLTVLSPEWA